MIDEQSPASGHDYASNRWAIGAGVPPSGFELVTQWSEAQHDTAHQQAYTLVVMKLPFFVKYWAVCAHIINCDSETIS